MGSLSDKACNCHSKNKGYYDFNMLSLDNG